MQQAPKIEVGRRVHYSGDMANLPGDGVIVAVHGQPGSGAYRKQGVVTYIERPGASFDVALFDGRLWWHVHEHQLHGLGCRFHLQDRLHGPAIVEMAQRKHAEVEAQRALDKAREELEHAAAIERLKAENPHLQVVGKYARVAAVAKNVRAALKAAGIKASVRSESFAGGTAIDVKLPADADAAAMDAANAIVRRFQAGHFDGMTDCYEYHRSAWCDLFGDAKYVHVSRAWAQEGAA